MSERFEFERFDLRSCGCDECETGLVSQPEFDGEWVKAQDALARESALQVQIRTLEEQAKRARNQALDEAAKAVADHNKAGRAWVPGSLWDAITKESTGRILSLKEQQ